MNLLDIEDLRAMVSAKNIFWTEHVALRLRERKIKRVDVINCIQNGEIIEQYPDDKPFPSCLILGTASIKKPLHTICGLNPDEGIYIITAYYPTLDKWESDFRTRKAGE